MGNWRSFNGGSFQGGFNGSLGAMGATQAYSLILTITRVVAPGTWWYAQQPNPFQMMFAGMGGMMGMGFGMFGMGGMFGMFMGMGGMAIAAASWAWAVMGMAGMAGAPPPPLERGRPRRLHTPPTPSTSSRRRWR